MSYQVLARKWRPQTFATLVGQSQVLQGLVHSLEQERLHHAYLFTGTRGVGKTTVARILAKCLNCETGVTATPCGECGACREITEGRFVDLIEIDAASRTKVEDTREILDNVQYAPTRGRYKIYLIDEVHMLSGHSFNALLKTLEEPPAHVKFLLATTDPQKLPVTVLSRCLQYHLKNIDAQDIVRHLSDILTQEGIAFEVPALTLIARAANGSLRDALSLLDQAIACGQGQVVESVVRSMLGSIEQREVLAIVEALLLQDSEARAQSLLALAETLAARGADFAEALAALGRLLNQMALTQVVPKPYTDEFSSETVQALAKQATAVQVQLWYQISIVGRRDLPLAPDPRTGFEMVLLRLLAFQPADWTPEMIKPASTVQAAPMVSAPKASLGAGAARPSAASAFAAHKASFTAARQESVATAAPKAAPKPVEPVVPVAAPMVDTPPVVLTLDNWREVLNGLGLVGVAKQLAQHCALQAVTDAVVTLSVDAQHKHMLSERVQQTLIQSLQKALARPVKVEFVDAMVSVATPAKAAQAERDQKLQQAETSLRNDPNVKAMQDLFGAEIEAGTTRSLL